MSIKVQSYNLLFFFLILILSISCGGGGGGTGTNLSDTPIIGSKLQLLKGLVDFGDDRSKPRNKEGFESVHLENIKTGETYIEMLNVDRTFSVEVAVGDYRLTALSSDQKVVKNILSVSENHIQEISINEQTTSIALYIENQAQGNLQSITQENLMQSIHKVSLLMLQADTILTDPTSSDSNRSAALTLLGIQKRIQLLNRDGKGNLLTKHEEFNEQIFDSSILKDTLEDVTIEVHERTQTTVYLTTTQIFHNTNEIRTHSTIIKSEVEVNTHYIESLNGNSFSDQIKNDKDLDPVIEGTIDLSSDLLLHYHFDDGYGDLLTDNNAKGNHGRITNAEWVSGYNGKALRFNGVDSYVKVPVINEQPLSALTISMFVRAKGFTFEDARLISKSSGVDNDDHNFMLSTIKSDGEIRLRARIKNENGKVTMLEADKGIIKKFDWFHVLMIYDGKNIMLYQNNELVGSIAHSGKLPVDPDITTYIGANPDHDKYFYGDIDQLRIYQRALNANERDALCQQKEFAAKLYAGEDQWIESNQIVKLNAKVSEEADHDLAFWKLIAGPRDVTFSNSKTLDSKVEFFEDGLYHLRLSIKHNELLTVDDVVIRVGSRLEEQLFAHWKMDDTENGYAMDWSLNNHHGEIFGTKNIEGKVINGLKFDGSNDYIDLGYMDLPDTSESMSISTWIKFNDFNNEDARIISKSTSQDNDDHIWMLSTVALDKKVFLRTRLKTNANENTVMLVAETGQLKKNKWHHVAMTYDGEMLRLFLDGNMVGKKELSSPIINAPTVPVYIGANPSNEKYLSATLDDLRIYTRALDSFDFMDLINRTKK